MSFWEYSLSWHVSDLFTNTFYNIPKFRGGRIFSFKRIIQFITVLFIIARTWKQPRCPSADEWIRKLWYIYTMEYYSAIKKNSFEPVLMRWMKLEPIIQGEISQKDKDQYSILIHIYGIWKDGNDNPICKTEKETQMYRTDFWTLWEKARVGCSERIALKQVYYQGWNRSPAQVGCMRQGLRAGALGRHSGMGCRGRRGGIGMGNTCKSMADSCQCLAKTTTIL